MKKLQKNLIKSLLKRIKSAEILIKIEDENAKIADELLVRPHILLVPCCENVSQLVPTWVPLGALQFM